MKIIEKQMIELKVNGELYSLLIGDGPGEVAESDTLAHTLRENLRLTGTKISCDKGVCGACTVIMDGDAVPSCSILTKECEGREIITIEGLADKETGKLHYGDVEKGFKEADVIVENTTHLESGQNPLPHEAPGVIAEWNGMEKIWLSAALYHQQDCVR